jgi:hypothetical protein
MDGTKISREQILSTLRSALEPLPFVLSMWEGGSAAFGRLDDISDIDLQLDVGSGMADASFEAVEGALRTLGPLAFYWRLPEPTWHGYPQRFYRLRDAPEFLYIDLVIRPGEQDKRLSEREHHGEPIVIFDKEGLARSTALDRKLVADQLAARIEQLTSAYAMLGSLARKEVLRGHPVDAAGMYHSHTLRPLVEMLRIRYCPLRHGFGLRYVDADLPADVVAELQALCYPRDADHLAQLQLQAAEWFEELAAAIGAEGPGRF